MRNQNVVEASKKSPHKKQGSHGCKRYAIALAWTGCGRRSAGVGGCNGHVSLYTPIYLKNEVNATAAMIHRPDANFAIFLVLEVGFLLYKIVSSNGQEPAVGMASVPKLNQKGSTSGVQGQA